MALTFKTSKLTSSVDKKYTTVASAERGQSLTGLVRKCTIVILTFDASLLIEEKSVEEVSEKYPTENILDNIEVKFINHQGGCGGIRQDSELLAKLLAGYVNNPNVAGATILSLGCQNLQVNIFKDALKAKSLQEIKTEVVIPAIQAIIDRLEVITKTAEAADQEKRKAKYRTKYWIALLTLVIEGYLQ